MVTQLSHNHGHYIYVSHCFAFIQVMCVQANGRGGNELINRRGKICSIFKKNMVEKQYGTGEKYWDLFVYLSVQFGSADAGRSQALCKHTLF